MSNDQKNWECLYLKRLNVAYSNSYITLFKMTRVEQVAYLVVEQVAYLVVEQEAYLVVEQVAYLVASTMRSDEILNHTCFVRPRAKLSRMIPAICG